MMESLFSVLAQIFTLFLFYLSKCIVYKYLIYINYYYISSCSFYFQIMPIEMLIIYHIKKWFIYPSNSVGRGQRKFGPEKIIFTLTTFSFSTLTNHLNLYFYKKCEWQNKTVTIPRVIVSVNNVGHHTSLILTDQNILCRPFFVYKYLHRACLYVWHNNIHYTYDEEWNAVGKVKIFRSYFLQ